MANDKKFVVKKGLATPNVDFANGGGSISATFLSTSNTLSFSGNTGQLFSITDSMSGTIFSVNDISGIPSIEVIDTGSVKLAETFGSVAIGANTIANYKFYVSGNTLLGNTTINNSLTLNNDKRLGFNALNGNTVYMIQQNDDNFVFYTTTPTGTSRAVYAVYANTTTSNLQILIPLQVNSTLVANNFAGSAGQVLTSSGAGVYWGAAGAGANNATYLAGRTWETAGAIGSTVANTGAFTTLTSSGLTKIGQTVTQAAPSATDILSTAHASISGQGGNYLSFGQYDSGSGFAQWIQSSFTNPTTATYNIVLQPVGGNVAIGSATAPTKLYVNGHMSVANGFGIYANGTLGANGLVLTSNGTSLFWGSIAAAANATFATTANNALFANSASFVYGKQESQLSVAIAANSGFATTANNSLFSNSASFVYGKQESQLSVANSAALQGATWQAPLGIGTVTANTGAFTTLTASANVNLDSGTLFVDGTNNRVGIGNTNPSFAFQVDGDVLFASETIGLRTRFISGKSSPTSAAGPLYLQFNSSNPVHVGGGTGSADFYVPNGNVAIGATAAPTKLFVNGHMSVANGFGIYANGVLGTAGFVLTSNGSSLYWANASSISGTVTSANNASYLNGKQESQLSVANAVFATNANNSLFSNSASFVYGKQESQLSVANAVYAQSSNSANFANAAAWLGGFQSSYYTNATNITTGTLAEPRLPFRMDQNVRTTDNVTFANLTITGSVTVTGNVTTWSSNNLNITDNMIYLNSNSQVANPDLGFAANYNDGTYRHTGFFRDATDGVWKVFDQYLPEPDASPYINTANLSFRIADFQANVVNAASVVINNGQAYKQIDGTGTIRTLLTTLSDSSVIINGYQGTTMINGVNGATYLYGSGAGSTVMTLTTGGNAGIGNTTPGQKLQVDGSVGIKNGLVANGTFGTSGQVLTSNGTVSYWANTSAGGFTGNTVSANATIVKNQSYYVNAAAGWVNMTMPSTVVAGDIFIVHSETGNTRILNNSINIMNVGAGNDLLLESGQTVWVQAVNTSAVGIMFTYPAGGAAAIVANATFTTTANNSLYAYGKQESQLSVNNSVYLQGRTWETPFAIGDTVANTGKFTSVNSAIYYDSSNTNYQLNMAGTSYLRNIYFSDNNTTASAVQIGTNYIYAYAGVNSEFYLEAGNTSSYVAKGGTNARLGVGITTPKTRLQVSSGNNLNTPTLGSATNAPFYVTNVDPAYGFLVGTAAGDGHTWLQAQRTDGTATAYNISLNEAGGNVAIGATTAPTRLYVNGHMSVANGFGIYANGVLGANGLVLTSNGTSLFWGSVSAGGASGNNANFLQDRTWQTAGTIGSTVANTGAFTTLSASANTNLNGNTIFSTAAFAITPTFKAYREAVIANTVSTAASTFDLSTSNIFNLNMTSSTTVTFTNPPASGTAYTFMLYCKQDAIGSKTITWPASVKWPNSSVPTMSTGANKIDVFNFFTLDGGTTYLGALSLANTG